jgi:predicted nucleic acid-binding protein
VTPVLTVLDSSPSIIYHQIRRLQLLPLLFDQFAAPPTVGREIAPSLGALPSWVREQRPLRIAREALLLDPGEREAIALAVQLSAHVVVLDDLPARRSAGQLGLDVTGSAGLLLEARQRGLIVAVRPELDAMIANGFFVGRELYRELLMRAGEDD